MILDINLFNPNNYPDIFNYDIIIQNKKYMLLIKKIKDNDYLIKSIVFFGGKSRIDLRMMICELGSLNDKNNYYFYINNSSEYYDIFDEVFNLHQAFFPDDFGFVLDKIKTGNTGGCIDWSFAWICQDLIEKTKSMYKIEWSERWKKIIQKGLDINGIDINQYPEIFTGDVIEDENCKIILEKYEPDIYHIKSITFKSDDDHQSILSLQKLTKSIENVKASFFYIHDNSLYFELFSKHTPIYFSFSPNDFDKKLEIITDEKNYYHVILDNCLLQKIIDLEFYN